MTEGIASVRALAYCPRFMGSTGDTLHHLPKANSTPVEDRARLAWCEWLSALATDDEAAIAAALAYRELDSAARDTWLSALDQDFGRLTVPKIAVYAPLLAVESDPSRRDRITRALGPNEDAAAPRTTAYSLSGIGSRRERIAVLVRPLYLEFVEVFACGYQPGRDFEWVRHDPVVSQSRAPHQGSELSGAVLDAAPLTSVVDELAHLVLSLCRRGKEPPEALRAFADFFNPGVALPCDPPARIRESVG